MNSFFTNINETTNILFPPTKLVFGNNTINQLGIETENINCKNVLIITDKKLEAIGIVNKAIDALNKKNIKISTYSGITPNPTISEVEKGVNIAKSKAIDLIVGFGGGSILDAAKVIAVMTNHSGKVENYLGMNKIERYGIPSILVPTTSGTGSEISHAAVLTDEKDGNKKVMYGIQMFAKVAIVDPTLTLSLPPKITAETGMDALTHAIEAFVSWKAHLVSDFFASTAIRLISSNLRAAYAKGSTSIEARYNMALASTFGLLALIVSGGGGAVHGLSYPLGVKAHKSHGESNAILLPYVMEYNVIGNLKKFALIAKLMNYAGKTTNEIKLAKNSIQAVRDLSIDINIPQRMRDINIRKEDIPSFVEISFQYYKHHLERNPRDINPELAKEIYNSAW